MWTGVLITTLVVIVENCKWPWGLPAGKFMNKLWYIVYEGDKYHLKWMNWGMDESCKHNAEWTEHITEELEECSVIYIKYKNMRNNTLSIFSYMCVLHKSMKHRMGSYQQWIQGGDYFWGLRVTCPGDVQVASSGLVMFYFLRCDLWIVTLFLPDNYFIVKF